jgi:hypothetical protein
MSQESPQELLNRKVREFKNRTEVLQAVRSSAKPTPEGYLIPIEVFEAIEKLLAS